VISAHRHVAHREGKTDGHDRVSLPVGYRRPKSRGFAYRGNAHYTEWLRREGEVSRDLQGGPTAINIKAGLQTAVITAGRGSPKL